MMIGRCAPLLAFLLGATALPAFATPYWIAWESDDWPENQGWDHQSYNYYGGPLATRTLNGGTMTSDGSASPGIVDDYFMYRAGAIDPAPGEEFVLQYRMRVDASTDYPWDVGASVFSNDGRFIGMRSTLDRVRPSVAPTWEISFEPGQFHTYEIRSTDMRECRFFLDGVLLHDGHFVQGATPAYVAWGDCCVPAASAATWDYLRFGVVTAPEADGAVVASVLALMALARCHRRCS